MKIQRRGLKEAQLTNSSSQTIGVLLTLHLDRDRLDSTLGRWRGQDDAGGVVPLTQPLVQRPEVPVPPVDGVLVLGHPVQSNTRVDSVIGAER